MIAFIRRNLLLIACGAVAIISLALAYWGYLANRSNQELLEEGVQLANRLEQATRAVVNHRAVEEIEQQIARLQRSLEALREFATALNRHEPLVAGVLPHAALPTQKIAFKDAYNQRIAAWLGPRFLRATGEPSEAEINSLVEQIKTERRLRGEPPGREAELRQIAFERASINKARNAWCYAEWASFDVRAISQARDPTVITDREIWDAQLSLWAQQDIIDGIVEVNSQAAEALTSLDPSAAPWVGVMPVKQVLSIRVGTEFFPPQTGGRAGVRSAPVFSLAPMPLLGTLRTVSLDVGPPPASPEAMFLRQGSTENHAVLPVRLGLVIDQRDLPAVLAAIQRQNLITVTNIQFASVPPLPADEFTGVLYGPEPVLQVQIDLVIYFLRSVYEPYMPDSVLETLGWKRGGGT